MKSSGFGLLDSNCLAHSVRVSRQREKRHDAQASWSRIAPDTMMFNCFVPGRRRRKALREVPPARKARIDDLMERVLTGTDRSRRRNAESRKDIYLPTMST